ncbi:MAG: hypothetical protein IJE59_01805 [Clostridia bacterium]|nr:hypothetical protein [Clostridia bacterium]
MNSIIRWYNQNRNIIWITVLTIIGVIALIQTLDGFYKNNTKEESSSTNISTTTYNNPNYSVVSKTEINKTTFENSQVIIKNFFDYCNSGKIEQAYNLISQDCKEELYPNVNIFKEKYYNRIFTESKMYNSTLWISNGNKSTYRLEIMGDILATGSKETMPIEEYYTIINENEEYKLNLSNYIGKEEINVSKTQDNITISILSKQSYMDYEKYEIKVSNETQKNIVLNTKQDTDSMYIQDENGLNYIAFLNEISEYDLQVPRGLTKTYNIKFNRGYKPTINIEKMIFEDIKIGQANELSKIEIDM